MIDFDAVDFSEFCSKELSSFIFFYTQCITATLVTVVMNTANIILDSIQPENNPFDPIDLIDEALKV